MRMHALHKRQARVPRASLSLSPLHPTLGARAWRLLALAPCRPSGSLGRQPIWRSRARTHDDKLQYNDTTASDVQSRTQAHATRAPHSTLMALSSLMRFLSRTHAHARGHQIREIAVVPLTPHTTLNSLSHPQTHARRGNRNIVRDPRRRPVHRGLVCSHTLSCASRPMILHMHA